MRQQEERAMKGNAMKSIIQNEKECYICGTKNNLERHHVIHGHGLRPLADKYGLTVWLCQGHHRGDMNGNGFAVHFNSGMDLRLKRIAQRAFCERYPDKDFLEIFGKNYL